MSYHLKSRPQKSPVRRIIVVSVTTALVVFLLLPGFFFGVGAFTLKTVDGLRGTIIAGYTTVSSYFVSHKKLAEENAKLATLVNELYAYKSQNEVLRIENNRIKQIEVSDDETIAEVIATPPQAPHGVIVVSVSDQVDVGDLVFSNSGVLLGNVVVARGGSAKIDLYSRGRNIIDVQNNRTGERYALVGKGHGNYEIEFPKDSDVQSGDVLIARVEGVHVVAVLEEIEVRESSSILTGYAKVPLSIFDLSHVVIKKSQNNVSETDQAE